MARTCCAPFCYLLEVAELLIIWQGVRLAVPVCLKHQMEANRHEIEILEKLGKIELTP